MTEAQVWLNRARQYRKAAAVMAANHPDEAARNRNTVRRIIAGIRQEIISCQQV